MNGQNTIKLDLTVSLSDFPFGKPGFLFTPPKTTKNKTQTKHLLDCLQRILNVCKSSWSTGIEVNGNVDIYNRAVTTELTTQILWPKAS